MNLDEEQQKKVTEWIEQGLPLSEIQNRLAAELGINMRYMDVRFLVDDLKLVPKDAERIKGVQSPLAAPGGVAGPKPGPSSKAAALRQEDKTASGAGRLSLSVDQ